MLIASIVITNNLIADEIWHESFLTSEKGYWGGGNDLTGITGWTLDVSACTLTDANDYIKTVTTSGGRMEAKDINGEAIWTSEIIDISEYTNILLSINVSETGSSTSTDKYVRVYYKLDGGAETLFETNGDNTGNFGSTTASQNIASGTSIQIIVRINNPNAGDKTIFDEVDVSGTPADKTAPQLLYVASADANNLVLKFNEALDTLSAKNTSNYIVNNSIGNPQSAYLDANQAIVHLSFANSFVENQNYDINIQNIKDTSNNILTDTTTTFSYIAFRLKKQYVLNKNELFLEFSRNLDELSAAQITNYAVNNAIANPQTAILQTETNKVQLIFDTDFPENTELNLHIENLEDENNIAIKPTDSSFYWHNTIAFDLVFNEIMADPMPAVALPEYEYLEIYNKTNYIICLNDWKLTIGTTSKTFPLINIAPNEYLLVCSSDAQDTLSYFGNTVAILGNSDLTNSGKELALKKPTGQSIDTLHYSIDWYQDSDKDNGGWSLERIDYKNTCGQLSNWNASTDTSGGTPGKQNAIYRENIDTLAPKLTKLTINSSKQIELQFNDELNQTISADTNNYLLDNAIHPQSAILLDAVNNIILLNFKDDFSLGQHQLSILNSTDLCGNTTQIDSSFYYYPGFAFDVLINEIMLDVNPKPNVLPAAKYIELYNQKDIEIDLNGWILNINDASYTLSELKLPAKGYLILCDADESALFNNYGQTYGIFSSSKLSADQGQISLYNALNQQIDYVHYSNDWYQDSDKDNGGWSLERIDYKNTCGQLSNWKASEDYKGGTPGSPNSVAAENEDATAFKLLKVRVLSSVKLLVQCSKNITETEALNPQNYLVDNNVGNPLYVQFSDTSHSTLILQFAYQFTDGYQHQLQTQNLSDFCANELQNKNANFQYFLIYPKSAYAESKNILKITFTEEVEVVTAQQTVNYNVSNLLNPAKAYKNSSLTNTVYLEFSDSFENGKEYTIHIENVKDLNGNAMHPADLKFIYFKPSSMGVVLNEILFNPQSGGVDFVEIYNNSLYPVDLKLMKIANRDEDGNIANIKNLSDTNNLLYPTEYLAITSDTSLTKSTYPAPAYCRFLQLKSMPSYPDDAGTAILEFGDTIIDEFSYNKNMHSALISDANGVSLERLNPDAPTNDASNWYSAAENIGFASPANKNSQYYVQENNNFAEIMVEPEIFSPDNNGYNDRVFIRYKFDEPGYIGNVTIYDKKGQLVTRIANNELLATQGSFAWDGLYENKQHASLGIYVIYFEVFNLQGKVKHFKKTCVLAAKLK